MSSEAITRNDLTAILNEVLPPTPSEYKKLLWTNLSPTSDFAAQTISLDLSDYDEIEIRYLPTKTYQDVFNSVYTKTAVTNSYIFGDSGRTFARKVDVTSASIAFGDALLYSTYGGTGATNNSVAIPTHIYGIKYERVLPPAMDALAWKLQGTASGNNTVAMPTDYNEIMLVVTGYSTYYFTMIVAKSEVSSSNIYPRFANYYNTTNNAGGYCEVNNSTARLSSYVENNGTNVTSQATFKLYYR